MSYCDVCGDLYRVEAATGAAAAKGVEGVVAVCTSCGKVESVTKGESLPRGTPPSIGPVPVKEALRAAFDDAPCAATARQLTPSDDMEII